VNACCQMASLQLAAEDPTRAMAWARRAKRLAEEIDDPVSRAVALQAVGWVEFFAGAAGGIDKLVQTVEAAKAAGWDSLAATSYVIIVRTACRRREYDIAAPYIRAGLEYCTARDFDVWRYLPVELGIEGLARSGTMVRGGTGGSDLPRRALSVCAHPCSSGARVGAGTAW